MLAVAQAETRSEVPQVIYSPNAVANLERLHRFLAEKNPDAPRRAIGTILDTEGVAVRTGHHCAMPVMDFFEVPATARASLSFYNTFEEIDRLVAALEHARKLLG